MTEYEQILQDVKIEKAENRIKDLHNQTCKSEHTMANESKAFIKMIKYVRNKAIDYPFEEYDKECPHCKGMGKCRDGSKDINDVIEHGHSHIRCPFCDGTGLKAWAQDNSKELSV